MLTVQGQYWHSLAEEKIPPKFLVNTMGKHFKNKTKCACYAGAEILLGFNQT